MTFDDRGRIEWTPVALFRLADSDQRGLIDDFLVRATPIAFPDYGSYRAFLRQVSIRIGVPPQNLFLRGSCQIGFSIKPDNDKLWQEFDDTSDLDLAIVDFDYFERIEATIVQWERRSRVGEVEGRAAERFASRQQDRFYNCCRVDDLPVHLCTHHKDAMADVAAMRHSGCLRSMKAFVFRDWWAVRARYEFDLRKLCNGVNAGHLIDPGESALPRLR